VNHQKRYFVEPAEFPRSRSRARRSILILTGCGKRKRLTQGPWVQIARSSHRSRRWPLRTVRFRLFRHTSVFFARIRARRSAMNSRPSAAAKPTYRQRLQPAEIQRM